MTRLLILTGLLLLVALLLPACATAPAPEGVTIPYFDNRPLPPGRSE